MLQDDIFWNFSPQKRARDESFDYALSDHLGFPDSTAGTGLGAKAARTRSIQGQPLERVSSQNSIIDMLDFAEHRHMLHLSDSFGDLLDLASGQECSSDALYPVETSGFLGVSCQDPADSSTALCDVEPIDFGEPVDEGRFKLMSLLGYRRSLALASVGSKHVASGVPFMSSDAIEHCLVRKPDLVQDLLQCF